MKFLCSNKSNSWGSKGAKKYHVSAKAFSVSADIVLTPELSLWGYPLKIYFSRKFN